MDWANQSEQILSAWTDAQKKIWSGWLETAERNSGQAQTAETWRQAVDTWGGIVKKRLEAQLEWSQRASDSFGALPNIPKDLVDWSKQTQDLGVRWNEAQQQLWDSYLGMVRKAVPVKMLGTFYDENQRLFRTWQESVEKIVEAQRHWAQMWTERAAQDSSEPAGKATKPKAAPAVA